MGQPCREEARIGAAGKKTADNTMILITSPINTVDTKNTYIYRTSNL